MYIIDGIYLAMDLALGVTDHPKGDMPNVKMPTMGGRYFWTTAEENDKYKLQVHKITGHARILDDRNRRIAWGAADVMKEKFRIISSNPELVPGDIIGIKRPSALYEHYAVYIGNDEVIHYAGNGADFSKKICVHKAPMSEFLKGQKSFFVLDFPDEYGKPTKVTYSSGKVEHGGRASFFSKLLKSGAYHLYTPEETIRRAESRLGENKYNLGFNNCEHFAIWCKTGISESHQVENVLSFISPLNVRIVPFIGPRIF